MEVKGTWTLCVWVLLPMAAQSYNRFWAPKRSPGTGMASLALRHGRLSLRGPAGRWQARTSSTDRKLRSGFGPKVPGTRKALPGRCS